MKTLRFTSLFLLLLTLTAYTLPVPTQLATLQSSATNSELSREALLYYCWLRDTDLTQLLAWLQEWGPFNRPMPSLLPDEADSTVIAEQ